MSDDPVRHPKFLEWYELYMLGEMSYAQLWENLRSHSSFIAKSNRARELQADLKDALEVIAGLMMVYPGADPEKAAEKGQMLLEKFPWWDEGAWWKQMALAVDKLEAQARLATDPEPQSSLRDVPNTPSMPPHEQQATEGAGGPPGGSSGPTGR